MWVSSRISSKDFMVLCGLVFFLVVEGHFFEKWVFLLICWSSKCDFRLLLLLPHRNSLAIFCLTPKISWRKICFKKKSWSRKFQNREKGRHFRKILEIPMKIINEKNIFLEGRKIIFFSVMIFIENFKIFRKCRTFSRFWNFRDHIFFWNRFFFTKFLELDKNR